MRRNTNLIKKITSAAASGTSGTTTAALRFNATTTTATNVKSHLPLAQISSTVQNLVKQASSATNLEEVVKTASTLSHNEQREFALIQRFMKLGDEKKHQALLSLCSTGNFEVVPFALAAGCNPALAINQATGASPLFYACALGHAECTRKFLDILIEESNSGKVEDALMNALGPVEVVQQQQPKKEGEEEVQQQEQEVKKFTGALLEAIKNGHEEVVKILVQTVPAGISSAMEFPERDQEKRSAMTDEQKQDHRSKVADTIVMTAVHAGKGNILRLLFSEEASKLNSASTCMDALYRSLTISKYGPSEYTMFWLACMQGNADVVGAVIDCTASASNTNTQEYKIDFNAKTAPPNEMSAFSIACLQGHAEVVRTLLTRNTNSSTSETAGLDVNIRSTSTMGRTQDAGDTPLMIAVTQAAIASKSSNLKPQQEKYEEIIRMLIEEPTCKIDQARGESDDMTPLLVACARDCPNLVSMLLEGSMKNPCNPNKKIDITYQSKKSELSPLLAAAYVGNEQMISELLTAADEQGLTEEKKNEMLTASITTTKQNILHLAIANGHPNLVEAIVGKLVFPKLIESGDETTRLALLDGRTVDLVTPLLYALHKRDLKSVEILAEAGAALEHDGVNLAGVCELEEGMEEYAKILKRTEVRREIAKKKKE